MAIEKAYLVKQLSVSQKQAVIKLIEKKGRDKKYIQNWRPIFLHNIDLKLISKALAERLKKCLTRNNFSTSKWICEKWMYN